MEIFHIYDFLSKSSSSDILETFFGHFSNDFEITVKNFLIKFSAKEICDDTFWQIFSNIHPNLFKKGKTPLFATTPEGPWN